MRSVAALLPKEVCSAQESDPHCGCMDAHLLGVDAVRPVIDHNVMHLQPLQPCRIKADVQVCNTDAEAQHTSHYWELSGAMRGQPLRG